jgi:hypothetical protein
MAGANLEIQIGRKLATPTDEPPRWELNRRRADLRQGIGSEIVGWVTAMLITVESRMRLASQAVPNSGDTLSLSAAD